MSVKVSILLATYNGAKFLPGLLSSLTQQTYPALEIVCCDDLSTDGTVDLLKDFAATSGVPVRIHINPQNKGYKRNFLEGIGLCRGDFVALCDQDDVWKPEKLERLVGRIGTDLRPSMVFSDCKLVDEELQPLGQKAMEFSGVTSTERERIFRGNLIEVLLKRPSIPGMAIMVNRQRAMLNLPENKDLMHDYSLSAGFALGGDYTFVDECLVLYRQHARNAIGMAKSSKEAKKARRLPVWDAAYREDVIADILRDLALCEYLENFESLPSVRLQGHRALVESAKTFKKFRLKRRLDAINLLTPSRIAYERSLTYKERCLAWMKDARSCARLILHGCIRHIGKIAGC